MYSEGKKKQTNTQPILYKKSKTGLRDYRVNSEKQINNNII